VSWQAALSLGVSALVAVGGYLLTYRNNLRLSERKDRLERVSRQLSEFYGPLFATASAGSAAWALFRTEWRPTGSFWDEHGPTTDEAAAWRRWMLTVFMPLNRRARDLIVDHADLLDEDRIPQVLLDVCAHVAAYEAVLRRWEENDFTEHAARLIFPGPALLEYAADGVSRLKAEQQRLLRAKSQSAAREPYLR
jgi:hypothetical protein